MKNDFSNKHTTAFFNLFRKNNKNNSQDKLKQFDSESADAPIDKSLLVELDVDTKQINFEREQYAQLVIRSGCYKGFYNAISTLESDYNAKQPSGSRLDEVKFITSIFNQLPKPQEVSDNLDLSKLNLKNQLVEKSYHTLVGACLYIHQRITDDYTGSWSASLWSNSESNSQLFKILDKHLSLIAQDVKQLSINQLKMNFILDEMGEKFAYPIAKSTNKPESKELFMKNINEYMKELCPALEDDSSALAL